MIETENDVEVFALEDLESNLTTEAEGSRASDEAYLIPSASGFLIPSASGFLIP